MEPQSHVDMFDSLSIQGWVSLKPDVWQLASIESYSPGWADSAFLADGGKYRDLFTRMSSLSSPG